jgi:DNA-formamidopyrimidine glycosylase
MPEVCEVALTAQILDQKIKKCIIIDCEIKGGRYQKNEPNGFTEFRNNLPFKIKKVDSVGKFLWFEFKTKNNLKFYLMNTFGLTGMWSFKEVKHPVMILTLNDNSKIWFSDLRNFGTIEFTTDLDKINSKINSLKPDLLKDDDFNLDKVKNSKIKIVKLLMDQKKIGSGIGNYLVAEILYRAKISPHRIGSSLTNKELDRLKYYIKYVIKLCYMDNHTGYMINLEDHLNDVKRIDYHPDIELKESTFKFKVYGRKKDSKGNEVIADKIIGKRSTYWVPAIQK